MGKVLGVGIFFFWVVERRGSRDGEGKERLLQCAVPLSRAGRSLSRSLRRSLKTDDGEGRMDRHTLTLILGVI